MLKITKFFIENPKLTIMFSVFFIILGMLGLNNMNSEARPAVDFATAIITTKYPGASAEDIETKITKPIEDEIRTVSDIKDTRSISQPGLSTIIIRVDMDKRGVSVSETMSDLQRALDRTIGLPVDLIDAPKFFEMNSEEIPVTVVAVIGDNKNRQRDIVADLLKDEIEDNKNVKSASLEGYNERRFNIDLDPKKMSAFNIGINEVLQKIKSRNISIPSGNLKSQTGQILTRIEAKISEVEELENIVIRSNFTGNIIKLKNISNIIDGEVEPNIITKYNGQDATFLTVTKKSGSDTLELVKDVNKKILLFSKRYEGELDFHIVYDESKEVKTRLSILLQNALVGLIIILLSLFLFMPRKIAISAALSLPLIIMATLGTMALIGINLNTITILALVIVLGMLIDDSVVISEIFTRYRHNGIEQQKAALLAVKKLWLPISVTVFTTIAAFLPMLVTKGIMGEFIKWIPIIVSLALVYSLIECFWFLPMRLASFSGKVKQLTHKDEETDWFHKFEIKFEKLILKSIKKRYLVLVGYFAIIIISIFMIFKANQFILFPADQTEIYVARFKVEEGARLEHSAQIMKELSNKIEAKIKDKVSHIIGRAGLTDLNASRPKYSEGSDVGYLMIYVNEETQNNISYKEVLKELRTITHPNLKELSFDSEVKGPPIGNDIEATFRSNSFTDINKMIGLISDDLLKIKGISDLQTSDIIAENEVFININYEKADRLGLTVEDVGNAIRTAIAGTIISKVTLKNKEVDLFVNFKENFRKSIPDLKNINIMDRNGNLVPLHNFATFKIEKGSPFIKRYDYKRSKTLLGNVDNINITSFEANKILADRFDEYSKTLPGISLNFGGAAESTGESLDSLKNAFILSIIGIFALLIFLFKSYLRPFIIITTIPLGLFGFSIAFFLHAKPISFMSIIGIVGLGGVIVNAGIILISYIMELGKEHKDKSLHDVLAYASSMRLRSVVITSITTIAGLAPTAYGIGGQDALLSPLTLSMMWGLAGGTILTLIWIPCAYAILEDFLEMFSKLFSKKNTS